MAKNERKKCSITFTEESLTKQAPLEECDINRIVSRITKEGFIPYTPSEINGAFYCDVSNMPHDFMEAQLMVQRVHDVFNDLPSDLREKFNNDPARFVKFVEDPSKRAEAIEMGLLVPDPVKIVPDVNAAPGKAASEPSGSSVKEGVA